MLFAVEVLWSHTTDSMCLAYMSTNDQTPKVSLPACIIYIYVLDYQLRKLKSDRSINRAPAYTLVCVKEDCFLVLWGVSVLGST